jgi:hypothetical protein
MEKNSIEGKTDSVAPFLLVVQSRNSRRSMLKKQSVDGVRHLTAALNIVKCVS